MEQNTEERLTLFPEGFPANLSVLPVNKREQTMKDISFQKCLELFQKSNHHGSSLKTFMDSLIFKTEWYSSRCVLHWKILVTKSKRSVFQLYPSMLHTKEIGSGLLPTMCMGTHGRGASSEKNIVRAIKEGRKPKHQILLVD